MPNHLITLATLLRFTCESAPPEAHKISSIIMADFKGEA